MYDSATNRPNDASSLMVGQQSSILATSNDNIIVLEEVSLAELETRETNLSTTLELPGQHNKSVNFGSIEVHEISPTTPNLLYVLDTSIDEHAKQRFYSNTLSNITSNSSSSSDKSEETQILVEDDFGISLDLSKIIRTHEKQIEEHKAKKTGSSYSLKRINSKDSAKTPSDLFADVVKKLVSPSSFRKSDVVSYGEIYLDQFQDWKNEKHENGAIISWRDICYQVKRETSLINDTISKLLKKEGDSKMEKQSKYIQILNGIDGIAYPGSILAIMAPSGAGKTSLLNILAGQTKCTNGEIIINGMVVKNRLKSLVGYVYQDDLFMGNLTVRETLRYSAMLKLPASTSYVEKMKKVDYVLNLLKLENCADTIIGEVGISKGISGGERKRLGIAIALLTNPPILILDEPSSSLDSKTALDVIQTISNVAKTHNITVIMTIHQPRSDILHYLDNLLLLASGKTAYFGSTNKVIKYFKKIGLGMNDNYNPADFVMDMITEDSHGIFAHEKTHEGEMERINKIVDSFEKIKHQIIPSVHDTFDLRECALPKVGKSTWLTQFFVMFMRSFLNQYRDFKFTKIRVVQQIIYAVLVGFIYFQTKNDQNSVQNKLGLLFFVVTNQWSNSFGTPISVFRGERLFFLRERGAKCFSISTSYFGKLLADMLLIIPHPVFFGTIVYLLAGLTLTIERFLMFILIILVISQAAHSFGMVLAILVPRVDIATMLLPPISTTFHVFSGFYRNIEQIPVYLSWFTYFSPFNYGFKALIVNEFAGRTIECPTDTTETCQYPNLDFILDYYGMNNGLMNTWVNLGIVVGISVGMRIIAYVALKFTLKPRKGV